MAAFLGYSPSQWVLLCHRIPRLDFGLESRGNTFQPEVWEYQQTLLVLSSLSALCLLLSLLGVSSSLIGWCCRRRGNHEEVDDSDDDDECDDVTGGRRLCCVTWGTVGAVVICCAAIGIGFYGNSEANDGMYQMTYSLATANHTLSSIDILVSDTVSLLGLAVSDQLTRLEELLSRRDDLIIVARNARRQAEAVIDLLSNLPLQATPPLSAAQLTTQGNYTAENQTESAVTVDWAAQRVGSLEEYRWLSYVLLLLLDLLICLFILLALAKETRWLLLLMSSLSWLSLFLSWGSLGLETATAVALSDFCVDPDTYILNTTQLDLGVRQDVLEYYLICNKGMRSPFQQRLTQSQRALSNIHAQLTGLEAMAIPQFPQAEKSLSELQQVLNVTEGNFQQLVALLNCRALNKDYLDAIKGLCYDGMEGVLYLSLFSFLSALSFSSLLCTLPRAWDQFHSDSGDYDDSDDDSEDPFGSHQGSKRFIQWQSSI
ncbi:protein tweety homolog 1 isoform X3 [Acipenser ruthenus]|uniref:protein tweety homolog 1 isoform X3 n=1 Tax=Acipenser ruthenus TaxID=7906 RepID=UPI0027426DDA|nr:protein tweety homolog 1 isoform X3 [Acipenser ruthenus]